MNWLSIIPSLFKLLGNIIGKLFLVKLGGDREKKKQEENANEELREDAKLAARPRPVDRRAIYDRLRGEDDK